MSSAIEEIVKLRAENEALRAENDYLKRLLEPVDARFDCLGLTATERRIVGLLYDKSPKWVVTEALYGLGRLEKTEDPNAILRVFVWKIRRKLRPLGVEIFTRRGEGAYWMDAESKARLDRLIDQGAGE